MKNEKNTAIGTTYTSADKQREAVTKKLKYGSLSWGFAVIVVVLCIAVNLAASLLSARLDLRVDITDDEARFFTISDGTKSFFEKLFADNPDWHITIRFLAEEDKVSDNMVLEIARSYESAFVDHVSLEFTDINSNRELWEHYSNVTQTQLTRYHVLVEGEYHTRAVSFANFYLTDSESGDTVAFTGEKTFTAAFVKAGIKESPVAVFTAGHGETLDNGTYVLGDYVGYSAEQLAQANKLVLFDTLYDMGFDVQVVDLNESPLPENTRLIIVSDPKSDFMGYDPENPDAISEMQIIDDVMDNFNVTLIVTVDDDTPELPELQSYLEQEYGLGYVPNVSVTDNDRSIKGSDGLAVLGDIPELLDYTLGSQLVKGFTGDERFVFNSAVKLTVSKNANVYGEDTLIATSPSAVAGGESGSYPLIGYTLRGNAIEDEDGDDTENTEYKTAYLISSTDFLADRYLNRSYGNRDLFESILRKANTIQEYTGVEEVFFVDEGLDITTGEARGWTVAVTLIAPAIIFAVALTVWAKRRHA